jgi:hypothetical protein
LSPNFTGRQGSLACFLGILRAAVGEENAAAQFVGTPSRNVFGPIGTQPS